MDGGFLFVLKLGALNMSLVIVLSQPIRIGLIVYDCIGPFDTLGAAEEWIMEMNKSSIMPLPPLNIFTLQKP